MKKIKTTSVSKKIIEVAANGNSEQLQALIAQLKNNIDCVKALDWTSIGDHAECVKILIPVFDPMSNHSQSLRLAA